jgi:hypothetical protein
LRITDEMVEEAQESVDSALENLEEDERWSLLQDQIREYHRAQFEAAMTLLRMEALRDRVCPKVQKKDWSAVLGGRVDLDLWVHRVRMAHALGMGRGKL